MNKKKILIITGITIVVIAIVAAVFIVTGNKKDDNPTKAPETTVEATEIVLPEIEGIETSELPEKDLSEDAGNRPEKLEIYTNPGPSTVNPEVTTREPVTVKVPK